VRVVLQAVQEGRKEEVLEASGLPLVAVWVLSRDSTRGLIDMAHGLGPRQCLRRLPSAASACLQQICLPTAAVQCLLHRPHRYCSSLGFLHRELAAHSQVPQAAFPYQGWRVLP